MMFIPSLLALISGISIATTSPLHTYRNKTGLLPAKAIFQFNETGTWLENLAVRPNGDLLMTMLQPSASLWTLKRPYSPHPEASLLHEFTGATGLNGIAETAPDVFVVLAAEYEGVGEPLPGSFVLWEVSFRDGGEKGHSVRKVTEFPEAWLANGVAHVSGCDGGVVLVCDSFAGSLWRIDTRSGAREVLVQGEESMLAPEGGELPIGINGLEVWDGYAYWSNSALATIYRVRIDGHGYLANGITIETVAKLDSPFVDDFTFDAHGLLWAATNADNKIDVVRVDNDGRVVIETVAGGADDDAVAGDSAVAFGRTALDRNILYVTTSGTLPNNRTEPAKVVAVDRTGFY